MALDKLPRRWVLDAFRRREEKRLWGRCSKTESSLSARANNTRLRIWLMTGRGLPGRFVLRYDSNNHPNKEAGRPTSLPREKKERSMSAERSDEASSSRISRMGFA